MTERLADVSARIAGIRQLGAVVGAMRGIAAARAQQAHGQLAAVDSYAATIAAAIGRALALAAAAGGGPTRRAARPALVLFVAEQGFAGAYSERLLDAVAADAAGAEVFLIGSRGAGIAAERGIAAGWTSAMPSQSAGVPKLADRIAEALYARIANGDIDQLEAVFNRWTPGDGTQVQRRRLFPLDRSAFPNPNTLRAPLVQLAADALLHDLTAEYMHAQLCHAALHAFAAENEARMQSMAAAHDQIDRKLTVLRATQRRVRQEEITAEIIELASGEQASQGSRDLG